MHVWYLSWFYTYEHTQTVSRFRLSFTPSYQTFTSGTTPAFQAFGLWCSWFAGKPTSAEDFPIDNVLKCPFVWGDVPLQCWAWCCALRVFRHSRELIITATTIFGVTAEEMVPRKKTARTGIQALNMSQHWWWFNVICLMVIWNDIYIRHILY